MRLSPMLRAIQAALDPFFGEPGSDCEDFYNKGLCTRENQLGTSKARFYACGKFLQIGIFVKQGFCLNDLIAGCWHSGSPYGEYQLVFLTTRRFKFTRLWADPARIDLCTLWHAQAACGSRRPTHATYPLLQHKGRPNWDNDAGKDPLRFLQGNMWGLGILNLSFTWHLSSRNPKAAQGCKLFLASTGRGVPASPATRHEEH